MLDRVIRAAPAVGWMAIIFALSSREQFPKPPGVSIFSISIVAHVFLYGVLALLLLLANDRERRHGWSSLLLVIAITTLYGATDEFHQSFVPGRDASAFDLFVDALGATIAVVFWTCRRTIRSIVVTQ